EALFFGYDSPKPYGCTASGRSLRVFLFTAQYDNGDDKQDKHTGNKTDKAPVQSSIILQHINLCRLPWKHDVKVTILSFPDNVVTEYPCELLPRNSRCGYKAGFAVVIDGHINSFITR